ncbi:MAG: type I glutamate--ammonia ligase, partial [Acidobacteria bacterium]|nr:type I glutamate--ammonia ligase [Acidobacteriota bacterium]
LHLYLTEKGKNAFGSPSGKFGLSEVGLYFVGGMLRHARGFTLITNPLINSYKRLVSGFEAPTHSVWSEQNVNPLVRVPAGHGASPRCEVRSPDPACNPYLALAVLLKAGMEGIKNQTDPGPPVNKDIYRMSARERGRLSVDPLPLDLQEALRAFQKDKIVQEALGKEICRHLTEAHRTLWSEYTQRVHPWELEKYLAYY